MKFTLCILSLAAIALAIPFSRHNDIPTFLAPHSQSPEDSFEISSELPFKQCGSADTLKISQIVLSPNPPLQGQSLTFSATGDLSKPIVQGSQVSITVKVGPIPVVQTVLDICSFVVPGVPNINCPLLVGKQTLNMVVSIPENVPKLTYYIKAVAKNLDGSQIFCMEGNVRVGGSNLDDGAGMSTEEQDSF